MKFKLVRRPIGNLGTNCILIANNETKRLIVFDAPFDKRDGMSAIDFVNEFSGIGYGIEALLFTHGHFDHTMGAMPIAKIAAQVIAHEGDRRLFTIPKLMAGWVEPEELAFLEPVPVTHWLTGQGRQVIPLIGLTVEARHTPGHSPGGVVYCVKELHLAIVGDTIFKESVGRTDLPGGCWSELLHSIDTQIIGLKDDTKLYPGHGLMSTISYEKKNNKFLKI